MLVQVSSLRSAASRLNGIAIRTPLLNFPWSRDLGALWIKPENLQVTGSFKFRGAYNALKVLRESHSDLGVISYSSGNHAQALAYAARILGVRCTVVMPEDALSVKVRSVRRFGAHIHFVPSMANRRLIAEEIAEAETLAVIPPYDHPDIIAGQGTVGLEILSDLPSVDLVLVPIGGGGLASGVASAIKAIRPSAAVIGVEPALASDARNSLKQKRLEQWSPELTGRTIADGLRTNLSDLTFEHLVEYVDDIVTVEEAEIRTAMRVLATSTCLVAEPSGAVATAAYLYRKQLLPDGQIVAVISGGNADPKLLPQLLNETDDAELDSSTPAHAVAH